MESSSSGNHLQKKQRTKDETRPLMVDVSLLDCPVCCEPLTPPIFQCENGHLACPSCCPDLSYKCSVCNLPVGHNRCIAMERFLESAFVPCKNAKFGCTKSLSYGKEPIHTHENECSFSQSSCPAQDCSYTCSYKDLFNHCTHTHMTGQRPSLIRRKTFGCGIAFITEMNISDKILILKDIVTRLCFLVQCFREIYGVYVTVSCIAPPAPEVARFSCRLSCTVNGHTMTYESPEVERILEVSFETPNDNFMLIPNSFLSGDLLEMKLCIKKLNQE